MKKQLKRIIISILAISIIFSLSACTNNDGSVILFDKFEAGVLDNYESKKNTNIDVLFTVYSKAIIDDEEKGLMANNNFIFEFDDVVDCAVGDTVVAHVNSISTSNEDNVCYFMKSTLVSVNPEKPNSTSNTENISTDITEENPVSLGKPTFNFGNETRQPKSTEFKYMGHIFALGDKMSVFQKEKIQISTLSTYEVNYGQIFGATDEGANGEITYDYEIEAGKIGVISTYVGEDDYSIYVYFKNNTKGNCPLSNCEIVGIDVIIDNLDYKPNTFEAYGGITTTSFSNHKKEIANIDSSYKDVSSNELYAAYSEVYNYESNDGKAKFLFGIRGGYNLKELIMTGSSDYDEIIPIIIRGAK